MNYVALAASAGVAAIVFSASRSFNLACRKPVATSPPAVMLPSVTLVVACKAAPPHLEEVLESLVRQDYPDYSTIFTVASKSDPAYGVAAAVASRYPSVRVFVAGYSDRASEKTHNLVEAIQRADHTEVYAFADSDIKIQQDWLKRLVSPLNRSSVGITTAGKVPMFVPTASFLTCAFIRLVFSTLLLAFGMPTLALAWGGSMAIRRDVLLGLGILEMWSRAVDDDISVSQLVRRHGLQVYFVPMFVPTRVPTQTMEQAFEWSIRQIQYLWMYYRTAWLTTSFLTVTPTVLLVALLGWITLSPQDGERELIWRILGVFLIGHIGLVTRMFSTVASATHHAEGTYGCGRFPLIQAMVSPVTVSIAAAACVVSAFRRTMVWGGTVYLLRGPEEIYVLSRNGQVPELEPGWETSDVLSVQ